MSTFKVHNPTNSPQTIELRGIAHTILPHGELELPIDLFRGVFAVRCRVEKCRELGFCMKAHKPDGEIIGGHMSLTYTPVGE